MKIAFDHQIFATQEYGGVSRYFVRLAGELGALGNDVRVVAPFYVNAYLSELPPAMVLGRRMSPSRWGVRAIRMIDQRAAAPLMARLAPDIVHETYYADRRTAPRRARTVLTVYDMVHEKFPGSFAADDTTAALKRLAVDRADHVICISESTRRDLIAYQPAAASKASVALLGFDAHAPEPATETGNAARPYLLFVGQRGGYKNFAGLLEAYAASTVLRDGFELLAVGGGAFSATETAAIAAHGLAGNVRQVAADDAALQRYYAAAAAFIYPSLYEGFGIPPLEAMAAGTPVIAIDAGSVPEVCGAAVAYAPPGDVEALRVAIESVVGSPALTSSLVAAGHARLAHFSWARCAAETAIIYRSLL